MTEQRHRAEHQPDQPGVGQRSAACSGPGPTLATGDGATGCGDRPGLRRRDALSRAAFADHAEQVVDLAIARALPADGLEHRVRLAVVAAVELGQCRTSTGCRDRRSPRVARARCRASPRDWRALRVELGDRAGSSPRRRPTPPRRPGPAAGRQIPDLDLAPGPRQTVLDRLVARPHGGQCLQRGRRASYHSAAGLGVRGLRLGERRLDPLVGRESAAARPRTARPPAPTAAGRRRPRPGSSRDRGTGHPGSVPAERLGATARWHRLRFSMSVSASTSFSTSVLNEAWLSRSACRCAEAATAARAARLLLGHLGVVDQDRNHHESTVQRRC